MRCSRRMSARPAVDTRYWTCHCRPPLPAGGLAPTARAYSTQRVRLLAGAYVKALLSICCDLGEDAGLTGNAITASTWRWMLATGHPSAAAHEEQSGQRWDSMSLLHAFGQKSRLLSDGTLKSWFKMKWVFTTGYRRPRESGGPGATAAALRTVDSRFCGNDEWQRQLVENSRFIFGKPLKRQAIPTQSSLVEGYLKYRARR
jgi:hypothetical protein